MPQARKPNDDDDKRADEERDPMSPDEDIAELELLEEEFQTVEDDDLAKWQQRVLERQHEELRTLEIMFSPTSGYDSLVVLSLAHNAIDDISPLLCAARTLRLLNLNANAITQLPSPGDNYWSRFQSLSLLFLAGNGLASWRAMEGLVQCPKLLWLCVDGNQIMSQVNAREFLINKLPVSLKALNDHVVTDVEYIKHAGRSIRFGAQNVRLFIGDLLAVPRDFGENEEAARRYITRTEESIHRIYANNSPTILTQRVVRGYVSRCKQLPLFTMVRRLVVCVQTHIRGYLFRRKIRREFVELVTQQGQQDLLFGPMDDALYMTGGAHRGLRKLVALIQQWRVRFRLRKQAIAVKKIRFWCQMVYQRYRYRSQQLLTEHQEIFIYYTASFEAELLEMALKTTTRDPVLMSLSPKEREEQIRQRCVHSGVSVLRIPSQSRVVMVSSPITSPAASPTQRPKTPQRIEKDNAAAVVLKKTLTPPLVRIFGRDKGLETNVMVTEKHLIQQDLAKLKRLKQDQRDNPKPASRRAVLVHIMQLQRELEQRLVIVNKKILAECITLQVRRSNPRPSLALTHARIRARGHAPTRAERRKMVTLMPSLQSRRARSQGRRRASITSSITTKPVHLLTDYSKMRVFIPWSIDMYMQIMASLDRVLLAANVSAGFALSYEQTRQIDAAVVIQTSWRAIKMQCKRDALEATIHRAVVCVQRWWRDSMGIRRRMAFLKACLVTCALVNSSTLFMEESVYQLISDSSNWSVVKASLRPCKEHALHCLMVNGAVEISLSPAQMMLYAPSALGSSSSEAPGGHGIKLEAVSTQRCGSCLPVWMAPGTPEHFEESMVSREGDATPYLLVDHVHVEPTLLEREMLLLGTSSGSSSANEAPTVFERENPFRRFALCRQVADVNAKVMRIAHKLAMIQRKMGRTLDETSSPGSFVRLTFDSIEEARHRALMLVAKTFDPITHSYARLYTIEGLVAATMLRHQWAVTQAMSGPTGDTQAGQQLLNDCKLWLQPAIPSKWYQAVQERLPEELLNAIRVSGTSESAVVFNRAISNEPCEKSTRASVFIPHRPAPPPLAAPPLLQSKEGPTPIHLAESYLENGVQPVPPRRPSVSSPAPGSSFSRHQLLTDRLGRPEYRTLDDMKQAQLDDREYTVRDLREERERGSEALIVDKRMVQRENAAELAGIHLEMNVKLQKIKYERELAKLQTRELVEREKMNERQRKLTRKFETSFISQTGAMMRTAARQAVETRLIQKDETRKATAKVLKEREHDALERRQDAKSYCFVSNQKSKREVDDELEIGLATRESIEKKRKKIVKQRIKEDKEIKKMLRLM